MKGNSLTCPLPSQGTCGMQGAEGRAEPRQQEALPCCHKLIPKHQESSGQRTLNPPVTCPDLGGAAGALVCGRHVWGQSVKQKVCRRRMCRHLSAHLYTGVSTWVSHICVGGGPT